MNNAKQKFAFRRLGLMACFLLLLSTLCAPTAQAQTRLIVRDSLGLPGINLTCLLRGCNVVTGLGDPDGQLFLVTFPAILDPVTGLLRLSLQTGIVSIEIDQMVNTQQAYADSTPSYLTDETRSRTMARLCGTATWRNRAINSFAPTRLTRRSMRRVRA